METPLLRVSRPISACSRCRNAKIKCDGKLPACSACERSNRAAECSSANDQFAKGKERSYVASLESRVERLERQISRTKGRQGSNYMLDGSNLEVMSMADRSMGSRRRKERAEVSDVDDLVSDFGFLSVNATARDFHGFTKEMSFARLVLSTSTIEDMPRHSMKSLPPMDEAILSIHRYLNTVSVLYPVLSETVIFGSLNAVYQHQGRYARYIDHWNVRMIFAIASITQSTSKNDIQYNDALHHASSALERAEAVLQPGSAVGIQSILLLLLFALLDPFHFSSWYLIGVASRAMVDLGLHQDPAEDTKIRESDLDRRHRIYQCVYMLDRAISITNLRAFSFSDDSANVTLPMDKIYSYTPSINSTTPKHLSQSLEPNVLLLQIRQTQSKWYQALFQSDPKALVEPWQSRCDGINDILNCSLDVSNVKLPPLQQLFQSELLYSNILFIWPPKSLATVCPYGRALVFHNAIEYARTVWMMCTSPNTNLLNSLCLARSLFVGQRLLAVLRASSDPLASLISLQDPHIPPCRSILPKIVKTELAYKLEDAIRGIQWINEVLEALSGRFGDSPNSEEFQRESISVLQPLLSYHSQRVVQIPETIPRALQSMSHIGQTTLPSTPSWDPIRDGIHYVSR